MRGWRALVLGVLLAGGVGGAVLAQRWPGPSPTRELPGGTRATPPFGDPLRGGGTAGHRQDLTCSVWPRGSTGTLIQVSASGDDAAVPSGSMIEWTYFECAQDSTHGCRRRGRVLQTANVQLTGGPLTNDWSARRTIATRSGAATGLCDAVATIGAGGGWDRRPGPIINRPGDMRVPVGPGPRRGGGAGR